MKTFNYVTGLSLVAMLMVSATTFAQKPVVGLKVGNKAPELAFKDPNGKTLALSKLKGKYVLIDFWASWCGPCRMENPNVVRVHKKYKDSKFADGKGFEVFSVSLDKNKGAWVNAIKKDGLSWPYHISDLKGWSSGLAALYKVNSIPASFLVNSKGIIVARSVPGTFRLRGKDLDKELDKYIKEL